MVDTCALEINKLLFLKGPSQPPPFSMTSKLLINHGEANSCCFTISYVPEGMFNHLEQFHSDFSLFRQAWNKIY